MKWNILVSTFKLYLYKLKKNRYETKKFNDCTGYNFYCIRFSSCVDESDNIVPQPVNIEEPAATIGNEAEDHGPMWQAI